MERMLGISASDIDGGPLQDEKYVKLVEVPEWMLGSREQTRENAWGQDPPQSEPKRLPHVIEVPTDKTRDHITNAAECLFKEIRKGRKGLLVFEGLPLDTFPRLSERFVDAKLREDWMRDLRWKKREIGADPKMMKWKGSLLRNTSWSNQTLFEVIKVQRVVRGNGKKLYPTSVWQDEDKTWIKFSCKHGLLKGRGSIINVLNLRPEADGLHYVDFCATPDTICLTGLPRELFYTDSVGAEEGGQLASTVSVDYFVEASRVVYHIYMPTVDTGGQWSSSQARNEWETEGSSQVVSRDSTQHWGGIDEQCGNPSKHGFSPAQPEGAVNATRSMLTPSNEPSKGTVGSEAFKMSLKDQPERNSQWDSWGSNEKNSEVNSDVNAQEQERPYLGAKSTWYGDQPHQEMAKEARVGYGERCDTENTVETAHDTPELQWKSSCQPGDLGNRIGPKFTDPLASDAPILPTCSLHQQAERIGLVLMNRFGVERMVYMLLQSLGDKAIDRLVSRVENNFGTECSASHRKTVSNKSGTTGIETAKPQGIMYEASIEQQNMVKHVMLGGNWFLQMPSNQRPHTILELTRQYFRQYPKGRMVLVVQRAQDGNLFISNYEKYGFTRAGLNAKFFSSSQTTRLNEMNWGTSKRSLSIMIMSPQLLLNNITAISGSFRDFGIVVIDECQNTTGASSSNLLMKNYMNLKAIEKAQTRIIGLASLDPMEQPKDFIDSLCYNLSIDRKNYYELGNWKPFCVPRKFVRR